MKNIVFTHIPKTAGTSFKEEVIRNNYGSIFMYKGRKSLPHIFLKKPPFITGHISYGFLERFMIKNYEYLTFLRQPVERAISHYFFILGTKSSSYEHPAYPICKAYPLGKAYGVNKLADNLQTRVLSGGKLTEKCTSGMLKVAKNNLKNHYPVFGIQEQYRESLKLIGDYYQLQLPDVEQKILYKKTAEKPGVDLETRMILSSQHTYDLELYHFALAEFEKKISLSYPV